MQIEGIAFDLDGTLLENGSSSASVAVLETLQKLKEKGIKLVIVTSRPAEDVLNLDQVILEKFDLVVCSTGSLIYKNENIEVHHTLNYDKLKSMIAFMDDNEIMYAYSRIDKSFYYSRKPTETLKKNYEYMNEEINVKPLGKYEEAVDVYYYIDQHQENRMEECINEFVELCDFKVHGQIKPKGINKGYGVTEAMNMLGCNLKNCLAFGDGSNDVSMFEAVGTSIAMGNSAEEVKKMASAVCDKQSEEGISTYCKKYVLGEVT